MRARTSAIVALLLSSVSLPALAADPKLELKRVMLSSGGVGYFEYEAEIDGARELGLDVPLNEVDDVLKSLVVYDSAGGVGGFDLPARDGTRTAFGDVPFGPEALQSPLAYLNALQGVEIEVKGPKPLQGRIMHAETVSVEAGEHDLHTSHTLVSVMTNAGLEQFVLEEADSVQVSDPALRAGIGKALEELRRASSHDMRHLTLHTTGTGRRTIRVGYVVAAPLWKATYRLVLPKPGEPKGRLQGWAVLENESGVDWNGVELTLQSGNPVTFRQALYQAYYVDRPNVPVEVLGRILPPVDREEAEFRQTLSNVKMDMPVTMAPPSPAAPPMMAHSYTRNLKTEEPTDLAAPAETTDVADQGEATIFRLPTPVVLPAAHTASVPILDHAVAAERLDLAAGTALHPLAAVRVTNESGAGLPAGVLTLYAPGDEANFAGDARLGNLQDGDKRLLSFAQDLRTTVERRYDTTRHVTAVTASEGVLKITSMERATQKIKLTAPLKEPKTVLLEIAKAGDLAISVGAGDPPVGEETPTAWRIPVTLKPGELRTLTVNLDHAIRSDYQLSDLVSGDMVSVINQEGMSEAARTALKHLIALQHAVTQAQDKEKALDNQSGTIIQDEQRVRQNLSAVSNNVPLHGRLLQQLEADEDKLATIKQESQTTWDAEQKAKAELQAAIASFSL
jgi:hypothetical protein